MRDATHRRRRRRLDASRNALSWAVDQARRCGAEVEAVHSWSVPDMGPDPVAWALASADELEREARREMQDVVAGVDERDLVEPVDVRVVRDDPAAALLAACAGADLIVVGTRGLSGRRDGDVGSVSGRLVRDARCPVVVVPG